MTATDDDKDVLAAEFVLGTLDAGGRANVRMLMAIDPDFVATVGQWEQRLGELHRLVDPADPSPHNWEWIKARIAAVRPTAPLWMPSVTEASAASPRPRKPRESDVTAALLDLARPPQESVRAQRAAAALAPRLRLWQRLAAVSALLALLVLAGTLVRELLPHWLPSALQPTPTIVEKPVEVLREVVREVPSQRFAEYVAVFTDEIGTPAFLLSVDLSRRAVSVRRLRPQAPAGKAYELWITTAEGQGPRPLGVLGSEPFTVLKLPQGLDSPAVANATFGISEESNGGAPSGKPSGALSTAKLVQTIPAAFPNVAP